MSSTFKNKVVTAFLIGILLCSFYFMNKKHNDPRLKTMVYGRIYDYKVATNLDSYYEYIYHYNNKVFYDSEEIDQINEHMIGKCFEVFIDSTNPTNSKLNLDNLIDCELYYKAFKTDTTRYNPLDDE